MEKEVWMGLVYMDYDLSDKFEYGTSGRIRNKKTGRICKQTKGGVTLNYDGITVRINIAYLYTGKYAPRKTRGKQISPKKPKTSKQAELELTIRKVVLEVLGELNLSK